MYLIDTNIFLEILLKQKRKEKCKKFLNANIGQLHISDFSLHSLGVILFRKRKANAFQKFIDDSLPNTKLLSLPVDRYKDVVKAQKDFGLDFDDAYQYGIAKSYGLKPVTMDDDFKRIKDIEVTFL
jgi:predicted nucleic acid-binding protein